MHLLVNDIEKACLTFFVSNFLDFNNLTVQQRQFNLPLEHIWLKELFCSIVAHSYVLEKIAVNVIIPTV